MSALQGLFSYPGLQTFTKVEYTLSQGISPGKVVIELPQELLPQVQPFGDATFSYGDQTINIPNCALTSQHIDQSQGGYIARVTLEDRRWQWRFGYVSGHYNVRMPSGANADEQFNSAATNSGGNSTNLMPGTEMAPQDLATFCLQAMGEENFDVSALPNNSRPEINWACANPAESLSSLCESLGCRVVYWLEDDSVTVVTIGQGQSLPDNGLQTFISAGANAPPAPSSLILVGGPTIYQGYIPLQAVGIDTNGSLKPINSLSYVPPNGWGSDQPGAWASFNLQPTIKPLVQKSIYKMWELVFPFPLPGLNGSQSTVNDRRQLKLFNRQIDTHFDPNNPSSIPKQPELWGYFDDASKPVLNTQTQVPQPYRDPITVDADRCLVITQDPLIRYVNGAIQPAFLALKVAFSVRDLQTWEPYRFNVSQSLNTQSQTQPRIIHREEIFAKVWGQDYDNYFNLTNSSDNTSSDNLYDQANYYLQAAAQDYIEQDSFDVPYAGLVYIQVDGLIQQVTWSISCPSGGTMTRASLATEHNP
jgi:hypothetical protein